MSGFADFVRRLYPADPDTAAEVIATARREVAYRVALNAEQSPKKCGRCRVVRPPDAFEPSDTTPDRLHSKCRRCVDRDRRTRTSPPT